MRAQVIFVVLLTVVAAAPLKAQVYQEWIQYSNGLLSGGDALEDLAIDDSGNVLVAGRSNVHYLTIKYDNSGNQIWLAQYNGPGPGADEVADIAVDSSGNVYVTGYTSGGLDGNANAGGTDIFLMKYDSNGNKK